MSRSAYTGWHERVNSTYDVMHDITCTSTLCLAARNIENVGAGDAVYPCTIRSTGEISQYMQEYGL